MKPDITDDKLICIVLTKNPYQLKIPRTAGEAGGIDYIKHGYHIQYVNLFISKEDRKMIQQLSNIGDTIYNNNWLLYGSYKNPDTGTYVFSKIYDHNLEEIQLKDFLKTYEVYNGVGRFKPNKHQLSQVLSIHPFNRKITTGFKSIEKIQQFITTPTLEPLLDLEELTNICSLLTIQQSDDYKTWSVVGLCLYTITNGSSEGLELYKKFSSLSSKYNETETTNKWNKTTQNNNYNLKSLCNLTGYKRLLKISPRVDLEITTIRNCRKEKTIYSYTLDKRPVRKWVLKPVEDITDYKFNYASDTAFSGERVVITTITDTYTNSYFIRGETEFRTK